MIDTHWVDFANDSTVIARAARIEERLLAVGLAQTQPTVIDSDTAHEQAERLEKLADVLDSRRSADVSDHVADELRNLADTYKSAVEDSGDDSYERDETQEAFNVDAFFADL